MFFFKHHNFFTYFKRGMNTKCGRILLKKEKKIEKKKEKKRMKEWMKRYIQEIEKRDLEYRRSLKSRVEDKGFLFNIWEKKMIFNFTILSHYTTNLFIDIQFPIEVIRYILYTLLICEQNAIKPTKHDSHSNYLFSPCIQSECIVNFWKNFPIAKNSLGGWNIPQHCGYSIYPTIFNHSIDTNLFKLTPHHCHNIAVSLPYLCWSCKRFFCHNCIERNIKDLEDNNHLRCNDCITAFNKGIITLFQYV